MYYIYPQIILAFILAWYLYDCYKRQEIKNPSTLYWFLGFLIFAFLGIFQFAIMADFFSRVNFKVIYLLRVVILTTGLLLIYLGVIKLITKNFFFRYLLPSLLLILTVSTVYFEVFILENLSLATLIGSLAIYVPLSLALAILFLLLYARLSFIKDGFKNNLGPLIISLGWFIFAIGISQLYLVLDSSKENVWLLIMALPYGFWLLGLMFLERETKAAFQTKMKIHGLRKQDKVL